MARQLDLFGDGEARSPGRGIGAAAVTDDLRQVAEKLPANLRFGTSSWSFPGWCGIVYDRKAPEAQLARHGLAAYARHPLLRAVGIDRTFYAPIPATAFAAYAAVVPDGFRFLVKAHDACTTPRDRASGRSNPFFLDPAYATGEVIAPFVEGLGAKAGALVFQFPPVGNELCQAPDAFADRLGAFLARLPRGPAYAVELRDRQLVTGAYFDALESAAASHCYSVHPRLPSIGEQRTTAGARSGNLLVVRWMLHSDMHYEQAIRKYEPFSRIVDEDVPTREALATFCAEAARRGKQVILTANNKAEGSAPLTVFRLAAEIVRRAKSEPQGPA